MESEKPNAIVEKYRRARSLARHAILPERFKVAFNTLLYPHWADDASGFWYQCEQSGGKGFRWVDVSTSSNRSLFEYSALVRALSIARGEDIDVDNLLISQVAITASPLKMSFLAFDQYWVFDGRHCLAAPDKHSDCREVHAPDCQKSVFYRNYNLWLRVPDQENGDQEKPLTADGEKLNAYGVVPALISAESDTSDLQVLWSSDSQRVLAVQLDLRKVESLPVVTHVPEDGSMRPQLDEYPYPLPGDKYVPVYRLIAIDVSTGVTCAADYEALCVPFITPFITDGRCWWSNDNRTAYFVDLKRKAKVVQVVEWDTFTGATRILFKEASSTWLNLSPYNYLGRSVFLPVPASNELIWYSERSGWAHLYLYDLISGKLKQIITQGEWVVRDLLYFDDARRELWLQTAGRVSGRDPYYMDICRIHLDSKELITVVSSDHDYYVSNRENSILLDETLYGVSPDGEYCVATRARVDSAPVSILFDRNGREVCVLEEADVSALPEGWQWPEPVQVTAADGKTDIYGVIFRPSDFTPSHSYPVIDNVFSYPTCNITSKRFDQTHHYMCAAALAELGFVVVLMEGRGTPFRSRAFLDHSAGSVTLANDLQDHIAGLKQLAKRYPYMDMGRVGVFGGWTTSVGPLYGLLEHPEFYKVGVTCAMPNSQLHTAICVEPFEYSIDTSTSRAQPESLADQLQGKLLMIHGMLDLLSPPAGTFRMVEALQAANKDFELLVLPNQKHAGSQNPYVVRKIWDFFVRHLQGVEPPRESPLIDSVE